VSFHAHPDDEALLTAGTLAGAAAAGHRVVLVFATSGEAGDADADTLDGAETLGDRRRAEAMASADALGVARVVFLGYADSGLDGDATTDGNDTFVGASPDEAAERLAGILREEGADVLTTYDVNGGYGHPDHKRVHQVGVAAAALAGTPVVLESTVNRDVLYLGLQIVKNMGFEIPPRRTRHVVLPRRRRHPHRRRLRPPRRQTGVDGGSCHPDHERREHHPHPRPHPRVA
jgi:LmbE family N-acetylglucosaminyl deacetylase